MDSLPPEAFLDGFPTPMAAIARRLQRVVHLTFPDVNERVRPGWHLIGYEVPAARRSIYFAYIAPEAEHVHLGFEHGWAMRDPHGVLLGAGITKRVRWLTFRHGDPIDDAACSALLREAADVAAMSRGERALRAMDLEALPDG